MNAYETTNAQLVTLPIDSAIAMSEDEDGVIWYHIVVLKSDGKWYSEYRAASLEDAVDVYSLYL